MGGRLSAAGLAEGHFEVPQFLWIACNVAQACPFLYVSLQRTLGICSYVEHQWDDWSMRSSALKKAMTMEWIQKRTATGQIPNCIKKGFRNFKYDGAWCEGKSMADGAYIC